MNLILKMKILIFFFTMEAFEIIFFCFITKFFMKYKYYIHHIISLFIFLILSITIDIILDNFESVTANFVIYVIIFSIVEAIDFCYIKYMMDVKYHSLYNMIFFRGVSEFFSNSIIFSIELIIKFEYNNNDVLISLQEYDKSKIGQIVIRFFYGLIFDGFLNSILIFQTINLFNPNFIFVCYEISKIANIFFYIDELSDSLITIIIIFIFQIISLLFYIEIFEYNFCGLNKNTKKNIILRERKEIDNDDINKDEIVVELNNYYFTLDKKNTGETDRKNTLLPEEDKDSVK